MCHYAECRDLLIVVLNVVMLSNTAPIQDTLSSLVTLHTDIRLGMNWLSVTNALAYSTVVLITTEKSFTAQAQNFVYDQRCGNPY
jgi:hypothetical protein